MKPFKQAIPLIAQSAYSDLYTLNHSYAVGEYIESCNVKGDIIECGIAAGSNLMALCYRSFELNNPLKRNFWGFDSFEGIQLAGKEDDLQAGIGPITHNTNVDPLELLISSGVTVHPLENVKSNFKNWGVNPDLMKFVKGWVQHTIPTVKDRIEKIAILRLDMDVYDPTLFTLRELYDKVSKGGVVIIDDGNLSGVVKAVNDFLKERNLVVDFHKVHESSNPFYFFKP